jgi:hypothetical protein
MDESQTTEWLAAGGAALAVCFTLHFGQAGCSGSGIGWPATPPQHDPVPQQHVADGPFTLQPHRRIVSLSRTTTG